MFFLIGKPEKNDEWWLKATGWNHQNLTLLVLLGSKVSACLSDFDYPEYDLAVFGNIPVNGTTVRLARYVRNKSLSEIGDVIDLR